MPHVADFVLHRLTRVGDPPHLRIPRRWHQRLPRRPRPCRRRPGVHPAAPRGDGRVHGVGHAKFTGEIGCCIATSGPRGHPSAERPVRRQDGPPAGARHRRAAEADRRSAPSTSRRSTSTPSSRTSRSSSSVCMDAGAGAAPDRPCRQDRARGAGVATRDLPGGRAGGGGGGVPAARARIRVSSSIGWSPPRIIPTDADLQQAADVLNERPKVAMLIGQGASGRGRRGRRGGRDSSAPAWPRRCSARTSSRTTCRSSPAPLDCSARRRATS